MTDFILFVVVWIVGFLLTMGAWHVCDDRIFGHSWSEENDVKTAMLWLWPIYLVLLVISFLFQVLILVPFYLLVIKPREDRDGQ